MLAAGNAWGEWDKDAFTDPEKRAEVEAASGGHPLPEDVPAGLEQLSEVWTAPIPNYAPPFLKSKSFGYLMAAMLGVGAILAIFLAAGWVAATWFGRPGASPLSPPSKQLSPTP